MKEIDSEEIKRLYAETKNVRKTAKRYNHARAKRDHTSRKEVTRIINERSRKGTGGGSSRSFPSIGIVIFAILIIGSSLIHMHKLIVDRIWYFETYAYLPVWLATVRYCFSWFQRIVGISTALGVLFLKNIFRKIAIAIGIFTICTVYWKHPYQGFLKHTRVLDEKYGHYIALIGFPEITFSSLTLYAVIGHCILDIVFWGFFIYYFIRPGVKAQFCS